MLGHSLAPSARRKLLPVDRRLFIQRASLQRSIFKRERHARSSTPALSSSNCISLSTNVLVALQIPQTDVVASSDRSLERMACCSHIHATSLADSAAAVFASSALLIQLTPQLLQLSMAGLPTAMEIDGEAAAADRGEEAALLQQQTAAAVGALTPSPPEQVTAAQHAASTSNHTAAASSSDAVVAVVPATAPPVISPAAPAAAVHPAMLAALQTRLDAGLAKKRELEQQQSHMQR